MARPKKLDSKGNVKYDIDTMCKKMEEYIEKCNKKDDDIPVFKECCLLNDWNYDYVMQLRNKEENERLSSAIKRILDWKETKLEKAALTGKINHSMAIFSLKQLGWKDKQEEKENNTENDIAKALINMIGVKDNGINK